MPARHGTGLVCDAEGLDRGGDDRSNPRARNSGWRRRQRDLRMPVDSG